MQSSGTALYTTQVKINVNVLIQEGTWMNLIIYLTEPHYKLI